ncbi:MAG: glutathione S-transferase family protein [Deltaproteobacteria bacterium]|nr:MAG: glutathione S-transferase family protein [Deltaproteobacteria bacterium]
MGGASEVVKLYVVGTGWGVPFSTSAPFPLKLEAWMRFAGIPFEVVVENNPGKGPKKKTPWIEDDQVRMGDSELIIQYLGQRHGVDLEAGLSAEQLALSVAIRRMFEEHYHQAFEHQLFFGRGGPERLAAFGALLPFPLNIIVPPMFSSALKKQLYARGLGHHEEAEIIAMGKADIDAASALLGDKPFFLGDRPTLVDATAFGFLGVSAYVEGDNPLFNHAASKPNLMNYCERIRAEYFGHDVALPLAQAKSA